MNCGRNRAYEIQLAAGRSDVFSVRETQSSACMRVFNQLISSFLRDSIDLDSVFFDFYMSSNEFVWFVRRLLLSRFHPVSLFAKFASTPLDAERFAVTVTWKGP